MTIERRAHRFRALPHSQKGLGILGGIFDPVHNGHLATANLALDYFGLPEIFFIPSGNPPHKPPPRASVHDRLAMLLLAVAREPSFKVWKDELKRKGVSYTIDTLRKLAVEFPGRSLYFIIGSDNLKEITTWREYRELLGLVTLCVAHRPGFSLTVPPSLSGACIRCFPSAEWGVRSSLIREYIGRGYTCRYLVPEAVGQYISKRKLYRS